MAQLLTGAICVSDIPKEKIWKAKSGKSYLSVNIWINDTTDQYGNNGSIIINQTKEDRESGAKKIYVGNLKFVESKQQQTESNILTETKQQTVYEEPIDDGDLPF